LYFHGNSFDEKEFIDLVIASDIILNLFKKCYDPLKYFHHIVLAIVM